MTPLEERVEFVNTQMCTHGRSLLQVCPDCDEEDGRDGIPVATNTNSSFSTQLPLLQLAWDSTSLGALKTCPRYYYYAIVRGYVPRETSVHLTFGIEFHHALEWYDRERAKGADHEAAMLAAVREAFVRTWDTRLGRPWPSDDKYKNRLTLIRSIVWYLDQFEIDPLETVIRHDGQPAVEQSFRFEPGISASATGEQFIICGHLDRLVRWMDKLWVVDRKTTKGAIGPGYFEKYSPDNQMSIYDIGGQVVWAGEEEVAGIIIDAGQVGVNFSRFQRGRVERTPRQREEFLEDLSVWLRMAEAFAQSGRWPQNDKACDGAYGTYNAQSDSWHFGCPYRPICSMDPALRETHLSTMYDKRTWDPLITREV